MTKNLSNRRILLIITGGIAAYKSLELIRRLRDEGADVRCILTKGGAQFVTPLSIAALSENKVYDDLWSLTDQQQMGHIRLAREADLIVVAPATANILARMAHGFAEDLASTVLLTADKPVIVVPSMNVMMWKNPATRVNVELLRTRGIQILGPAVGLMACGEKGEGRMSEIPEIMSAIMAQMRTSKKLSGKRALVTSGPTYEPLDPVRFIGNRSSGKQGHAIAEALFNEGAETLLITGPTLLPDISGIHTIHVQTACQMLSACQSLLPLDIAVCAAAVSDWRPASIAEYKLKKSDHPPAMKLVENPDILAILAKASHQRPPLVVGFAAETEDLRNNALRKLAAKECDWIVANRVDGNKAFDRDENEVMVVRRDAAGHISESAWPRQSKRAVAKRLVEDIALFFNPD